MSRRAKKQHSERAPLSEARSGRRKQQRRKAQPVLTVVPNAIANSLALTAAPAAAAAPEPAPARAPASLLPPAATLAPELPSSDEALLDVELSFFEGWSASAPGEGAMVDADSSPLIADELDSLLTPAQQQRRQWFRRQVTALMAGVGAFGAAAVAVRIASLL